MSRPGDACDAWRRVAALEPQLEDDTSRALARCDAPDVAERPRPVEPPRPGAGEDRRDLLAPLVRNKPPLRARLDAYEAAEKSDDPALVFEAWRFLSVPPPPFVGAKERELSVAGARTIGSRFLDLSPASDPRRAVVRDWMKQVDAAR